MKSIDETVQASEQVAASTRRVHESHEWAVGEDRREVCSKCGVLSRDTNLAAEPCSEVTKL